jgi:hypothetical protein
MAKAWANAKNAFKRDGNLRQVLAHVDMSPEHQTQLMNECQADAPTRTEPTFPPTEAAQ